MPSLIDLRRRIRAVRSTQQITKAMKMIAASRLRRAQERMMSFRPYSDQARRLVRSVATRVDASRHPLLQARPGSPAVLLVVMTSDKGLCGSFNTNVLKQAGQFIAGSPGRRVVLALVGRKGRDFFRRRGFPVCFEAVNVFGRVRYEDAQDLARVAIDQFVSGAVGEVHVVFNEFRSVLQQRVTVESLLPLARIEAPGPGETPLDYLYEPSPAAILDELLPRTVEIELFRAMLESAAAEHAARMTAMDAATKNSAEVIDQLTLYMNKVRQAAITREIIEVVSGAEAL